MNYLAEGLSSGYDQAYGAAQKKREQRLQQQLELDMLAKRQAAEKQLQDDRITAEAKRQFSQQGWQSGEADKDRGFRTSERIDTQGFQSGESDKTRGFQAGESKLDRDLRRALQQQQLDQAAKQFGTEMQFKSKVHDDQLPLEGARLGLMARSVDARQDKIDWDTDPENPANAWRAARAAQVNDLRGLTPPGAPTAPGAAPLPSAAELPILTPEQARAAKPGTKYRTTDGRILTR